MLLRVDGFRFLNEFTQSSTSESLSARPSSQVSGQMEISEKPSASCVCDLDSPADPSCTTAVLGVGGWWEVETVSRCKKKTAAFEDWLCECEVGCMMNRRNGIFKNCNVSK